MESIMKQKFARLGRSVEFIFADSKVYDTTKKD